MISKLAEFAVPPLLDARTRLPPTRSAMSGARFRASRGIFAVVPRTRTMSVRRSPGFKAEASASKSSPTSVTENGGAARFPQETSIEASPGSRSGRGRIISETGEDASTSAERPAIFAKLESASPQKPLPRTSKRSASEVKRGMDVISMEALEASDGMRTAVGTRPGRPSREPKITPALSGATNNARPVASVVRRSPLEKCTVAPGVKRPPTSSTASVALSPETMRRGRSKMRAAAGEGGCCAADCGKLRHAAKTGQTRIHQERG